MKGYVYVLEFVSSKRYIGSTNDVERRFKEHSSLQTKSIRQLGTFTVLAIFEFENVVAARKIEYYIKKQKSRKFMDKLING
ncbi:MAG: GIY-YIG nuclease family protein, partial [Candidatus Absconditabacterales bacterium]